MTRTRAALLLPLALAGCGQDGQSDPIAIPARPTPVATVAAPARGSVGAPSTATVDPAANMPPFGDRLSPDQLSKLASYLAGRK